MELRQTLFPEPVAPAMRRWGMRAKSAITGWPETSRPRAMVKGELSFAFWKASDSITPRKATSETSLFGTSIPTTERPGTGASIRIGALAKAKAKSLSKEVILLTLTFLCLSPSPRPSIYPGSTPNWVTVGP